jgi:hypothetical protein
LITITEILIIINSLFLIDFKWSVLGPLILITIARLITLTAIIISGFHCIFLSNVSVKGLLYLFSLKLKFRKNKKYHEARTLTGTQSLLSLSLTPLKLRLIYVTWFRLSKSLNSRTHPFTPNALIILVLHL